MPIHIRERFYKTLKEDLSVESFEQWLYADTELEEILRSDDYYDLISLNYRQQGSKYQLWKLLQKHIDLGDFETYKMLELLHDAQKKNDNLPYILMRFYDLYCDGYHFLQRLGLGYGLSVLVPNIRGTTADTWEELTASEQTELLESLMPEVQEEIERVKNWIVNKEIILTGQQDERGEYDYTDFRMGEQKKK